MKKFHPFLIFFVASFCAVNGVPPLSSTNSFCGAELDPASVANFSASSVADARWAPSNAFRTNGAWFSKRRRPRPRGGDCAEVISADCPQWMELVLTRPQKITGIQFRGYTLSSTPYSFTILGSDLSGVSWQQLREHTGMQLEHRFRAGRPVSRLRLLVKATRGSQRQRRPMTDVSISSLKICVEPTGVVEGQE